MACPIFSNHLILQEIISSLPSPIKGYRLVSHSWNQVILSLPEPRLGLIVNSINNEHNLNPETFSNFAQTMDPMLAKNIGISKSIDVQKYPYFTQMEIEAVAYMNLKFCIQNFSQSIQFIDLGWNYIRMNFVAVLHQLLQDHCPNLVGITLRVLAFEDDRDFEKPQNWDMTWRDLDLYYTNNETVALPIKRKLAVIDVRLFENVSQHTENGILHVFFENLVQAAPNLIQLHQELLSFPDLSKAVKLQTLDFIIPTFFQDFPPSNNNQLSVSFNLSGLSRMIMQVSQSLKYLKLEVDHYFCGRYFESDCNCAAKLNFIMPPLPSLRSLSCSDVDLFLPPDPFNFENKLNQFSKLVHVEFGRVFHAHVGGISTWLNEFTTNGHIIVHSVTSVLIDGISNLEPLLKLTLMFPNIQKLYINKGFKTITTIHQVQDPKGDSAIESQLAMVMGVCSSLNNLKELDANICFPHKFSTLVQILYNSRHLFSSGEILETFKIRGSGSIMEMHMNERTLDCLAQFFLYTQDMKSVEIYNTMVVLPWQLGVMIGEFIVKNKLPITIRVNNS